MRESQCVRSTTNTISTTHHTSSAYNSLRPVSWTFPLSQKVLCRIASLLSSTNMYSIVHNVRLLCSCTCVPTLKYGSKHLYYLVVYIGFYYINISTSYMFNWMYPLGVYSHSSTNVWLLRSYTYVHLLSSFTNANLFYSWAHVKAIAANIFIYHVAVQKCTCL